MADKTDTRSWEEDKALYLFTSLSSGSSAIITATSRIETILKANRIPFSYVDTATNESAKKLYQRRAKGKKLPLLFKEGDYLGDLEQVEEWNEFGELKAAIGTVATNATSIITTPAKTSFISMSSATATPSKSATPSSAAAAETLTPSSSVPLALRQAAFESANAAKEKKAASTTTATTTTTAGASEMPPPSPAKVPLPASPMTAKPMAATPEAPLSPTSPVGLKSPTSPAPSTMSAREQSHSRHGSQSSAYRPEHFDAPPNVHRGSSLSLASEEEIKAIENAQAIPEENEEECEAAEAAEKESKAVEVAKKEEEEKKVETSKAAEVAKKDESAAVMDEGDVAKKTEPSKAGDVVKKDDTVEDKDKKENIKDKVVAGLHKVEEKLDLKKPGPEAAESTT
ncbi:hypothetical protein BT63DRAFT_475041 [Microthyrium microscopicum]|uniref:Uncharacterized protein n=1 Tax=Microthyrium microscopicum TaxID=703497 RepID=A0A6A6UVC6_9PEZI|nr:hypothetical protein BT63DRAFT_475041 [Microthyrium microscopicum]